MIAIIIAVTLIALVSLAILFNTEVLLRIFRRIEMKVDDLIAAFDKETTDIAARVDALVASIKANGQTLTADQEAKATAISARLESIGADPADPIPTLPTP
jgi:cell shape-determining protein MreC